MIPEIVHSFSRNVSQLQAVIGSLDDDALFFQPGGGVNHIAWTVGHLVYSFQAIGDEMGIPRWLSPEWVDLFGEGSHLHPNRERYPEKALLLEALQDGKSRVLDRLERMSAQDMAGPLPDERFRNIFPTLGHAVLNTLVSHFSFHYGQVCAMQKLAQASNHGVDRIETGGA